MTAPTAQSITPGSLVMFDTEQTVLLGVILETRKDRLRILSERNREVELTAPRLHQLPGTMPFTQQTRESQVQYLTTLREEAETAAAEVSVEELWSVVRESPREWREQELSELLQGKASLAQYVGLRLAMIGDRIYFKRDKAGFIPRSVEVIDQLKHAELVRLGKKQLEVQTVEFLTRRLAGAEAAIPDGLRGTISMLEECAASSDRIDHGKQREIKELLQLFSERTGIELRGSLEERAYELLCRIKHFSINTNLVIYRHNPRTEFPGDVLDESKALSVAETLADFPEEMRGAVRDMTRVRTLTIDDISTRDMDDALSIEQTPEGYELGIHISNVALSIVRGSALEREARLRATSIYNSDLTLNMFPEELSENKLSLLQDHVRPAVSCLFTLDQRLNVTGSSIQLTLIKVQRRLSYDQVDELLSGDDHDLSLLYNIASEKEQERIEQGAVKVQKGDALTVLNPDGTLSLMEVDEQSPARSLVGEMMVMANACMARSAAERGIPLIFRGQPAPDRGRTIDPRIPEGPARDYALRSLLKKSSVAFTPQSHASLGLAAYAQITSPIRRFADLVNQRQIVHMITSGTMLYTPPMLEELMFQTEEALSKATQISRQSKRFWLLRHLQESTRQNPEVLGTIIRTDLKSPIVELEHNYLTLPVRTDREVKPGDRVRLRVVSVKPQDDQARLELIGFA